MTAGEITLVTGWREGAEEGGMGAWCTISRVDSGFHLPFSKGHGASIGRQDSSKDKPLSLALYISALRSVGWGVEKGEISGTLGLSSKGGGVGGSQRALGAPKRGLGTGE